MHHVKHSAERIDDLAILPAVRLARSLGSTAIQYLIYRCAMLEALHEQPNVAMTILGSREPEIAGDHGLPPHESDFLILADSFPCIYTQSRLSNLDC